MKHVESFETDIPAPYGCEWPRFQVSVQDRVKAAEVKQLYGRTRSDQITIQVTAMVMYMYDLKERKGNAAMLEAGLQKTAMHIEDAAELDR